MLVALLQGSLRDDGSVATVAAVVSELIVCVFLRLCCVMITTYAACDTAHGALHSEKRPVDCTIPYYLLLDSVQIAQPHNA